MVKISTLRTHTYFDRLRNVRQQRGVFVESVAPWVCARCGWQWRRWSAGQGRREWSPTAPERLRPRPATSVSLPSDWWTSLCTSVIVIIIVIIISVTTTTQQPFYGPLSGTRPTRVSQYQKKHLVNHPPSWSSSSFYQLLPSTTSHSILPVQITCLAIFLHNLSPSPLWSTSWSGALHLIFHTFLHPISVFFSQHMPIPLQPVTNTSYLFTPTKLIRRNSTALFKPALNHCHANAFPRPPDGET